MTSVKKTAFGAALFYLLFFASAHLSHAAFGVSPPFLNADHLTPGITYTQTIYLVQDQPTVDLPIKVTLTIPQPAASWVTLDNGFNFIIPKGTHQFPVTISVRVPQGQGLGKFNGDISFTSQPSQAGQVTVALGVDVALNFTIGSDVFEKYSVPLVQFPDIEEGWDPQVLVKFENDGNIPESFDTAVLQIYDQFDAMQLAYITKQDGFPQTPAFNTQEYVMNFPTNFHLGVGDYWGNISFYKNNQVIASQKTIFHVVPTGTLSRWSAFLSFLKKYWIYISLAIILIAGFTFFGMRRRKSQKK